MSALRIDVTTPSRSYPVHVGEGLTDALGDVLDADGASDRRFVVSSPTVWRAHGRAIERAVPAAHVILVPDGERSKTTRTVARIYEELLLASADRSATVVAVGGGVIGDMAGFAAATILRGVALVQVPTTLLAQVDAAIGGKVGVNHALGKNLIGAFHQPLAVVADPRVLRTLPRREFRAGLYEVIKYGVIAERGLFERVARDLDAIFAREPDALVPVIAESCRIKADIVSQDEREGGLRRLLNFGHTAGHAIEAVTKYRRFRHGEAVGYGMLAVADVAVRRGALDEADREALAALIARLGPLPSVRDLSAADIVQATRRDKKVIRGTLHVVLPTGIGTTEIVDDVTERELARALRAIGMRP
ncbi:MAG: 3-dehydroquinate synthase [Acidobacteria bacterium]|nr:3-dehydroquinate synthase [Acidobacteriota bacterium]